MSPLIMPHHVPLFVTLKRRVKQCDCWGGDHFGWGCTRQLRNSGSF